MLAAGAMLCDLRALQDIAKDDPLLALGADSLHASEPRRADR